MPAGDVKDVIKKNYLKKFDMNLSNVLDHLTAKTCEDCAQQRAEYLKLLNVHSVLELCVGPSLSILEKHYMNNNIHITGNDIDSRWKRYYPKGNWIISDALNINYNKFDAIVFAPPLSKGCTGRRSDSLMIDQVQPGYSAFLEKISEYHGIAVMVLPGRSLATSQDRNQYYKLVNSIYNKRVSVIPLMAGTRKIIKYYDLILESKL